MKDWFMKNLKLKIIAVLFAAGLWMISININDPYQSKDYSVEVQLLNMNVLTGAGKYVEVANNTDEITVKVKGNRSVMDTFSTANIVATADLNEMDENHQVPIKLGTIKTNGSKIESIRSNNTYVEVKVENVRRVQKTLEVVTRNTPGEGYILGKISTEQNALRISGPESAVAMVDKAVVNFDLANATDDVSMILPVELYDAQGNRINDSRLTTSINEVQCVATILATKEIPLVFTAKGAAAKGYEFTGEIQSEPDTIVIASKNSVLRGIKKLEIKDAIDIEKAKENVTATVDVKEYLPENVVLAEPSFTGKVAVTAFVEEIFTKEMEISREQIQIVNVPEGIIAEIENPEENIVIEVDGFVSAQAGFLDSDVKAKVDILSYMNNNNLMELEAGEYEMEIKFELPEKVWIEDKMQTKIIISKK
ncbi:MAG: hypothetical protein IKY94_12120 [Lachnospiraceae bacterium]|nr:hypothetical protein [Lachnospiraceae bacterium]